MYFCDMNDYLKSKIDELIIVADEAGDERLSGVMGIIKESYNHPGHKDMLFSVIAQFASDVLQRNVYELNN